MKPSFALTLIICAYVAPVFLWPHAVNTAVGAEPDTPPAAAQQQAAGKEAQPPSPLFEALESRASEDAARQTARESAKPPDPVDGLGPGTHFRRDGTAARRDRDVERPAGRTTRNCFSGTASGSRPAGRRLFCRRASAGRCRSAPGARCCPRPSVWPAGLPPDRPPVHHHVRRRVLGSRGCKHRAERIRKRTNEG